MYDILIIGGGASGLAAAISAARLGATVAIVEKLPRTGKKLLSTGNGRCNLSHLGITAESYSGNYPHVAEILRGFNYADFFAGLGLLTTSDSEGRVYPMSNAASSVLDALRLTALHLGVTELCDLSADKITAEKDSFTVTASGKKLSAKRVIVAAGGKAAPSLGSDGSGIALLKSLGHTVTPLLPSLAPVKTDAALTRALKGLRVGARATLVCAGKPLKAERGEVQFGDGALSGICVFNLSELAAMNVGSAEIALDLMPDTSDVEVTLKGILEARADCPLEDYLSGIFQKRIGTVLLRRVTDKPLNAAAKTLTATELKALSVLIKHLSFPVTGVSDWQQAQVCCGGIDGREVDERLMSKKQRGLYVCGEILNVQAPCGGYNLNWAWASGCAAGASAAESLR